MVCLNCHSLLYKNVGTSYEYSYWYPPDMMPFKKLIWYPSAQGRCLQRGQLTSWDTLWKKKNVYIIKTSKSAFVQKDRGMPLIPPKAKYDIISY